MGKAIQVRVKNLTGFLGRKRQVQRVCNVHLKEGGIYNVRIEGGAPFLIDDGNRLRMKGKPYQQSNRCEFQVIDTSYANEAHADLVVVGGKYDDL